MVLIRKGKNKSSNINTYRNNLIKYNRVDNIFYQEYIQNMRKDKFGIEIVNNLLSFHKSSLIIVTYPERGSKLFFNMSFIDEL
jgi:hypothetical protein